MVKVIVNLLDSVFSPLLAPLGPVGALFVTSVSVTILLTLAYGLLVDQEKMHRIKREMQKLQKKMKKAQQEGNEKAIEKLATDSMRMANEQLGMMLRFYIGSMLVILVVFPWVVHAFGPVTVPVYPGNSTVEVPFSLVYGGTHTVPVPENQTSVVTIDTPSGPRPVTLQLEGKDDETMLVARPFEARLPFPLPFVGVTVGWLGFYILVSIPFSMFIRKLFGMA